MWQPSSAFTHAFTRLVESVKHPAAHRLKGGIRKSDEVFHVPVCEKVVDYQG